jgi:hypothetical protein
MAYKTTKLQIFCAKCLKPVDEVVRAVTIYNGSEIIVVKCHGEEEEFDYLAYEIAQVEYTGEIAKGIAFANKNLVRIGEEVKTLEALKNSEE